MLALLLALACQPPDPDAGGGPAGPSDGGATTPGDDGGATTPDTDGGASTAPTEEEGSTYVYEEEEEQGPLHDLDEVGASVVEVLDAVVRVDPQTLTALYESMRVGGGDESCPYYYTDGDGDDYYGYQYWYDSCTSGGGTTFQGYGYSYVYEPYTSGGYRYYDQSYVQLYGSITDRLGDALEVSGYYYHYSYGAIGSADRAGYAYLVGDARWSDEDALGSWLGQDLSLDLTYSWSHDADVEVGTALSVDGGLSGLGGQMNAALLDSLYLYAADAGSPCEIEPAGTISVRDAEGEWYHVAFQGPAWAGAPVFGPDCDGCGLVTWRGQELGQVCPDFSVLTAWEGRPWD